MSGIRNLTSDRKVLYVFSLALFAVLLPLIFIDGGIGRPIAAVLLVLSAASALLFIKKRSILSINKPTVSLLLAVIGVLYVTAYYLSGLSFGLYYTPHADALNTAVGSVIPIAAAIIAIEIVRVVVLAQENTPAVVAVTLSAVVVDIIIASNPIRFDNFNVFMDFIGLTLLPAITANLLYNYLSQKYGCLPNVLYRCIVSLYIYVIPYTSAISSSIVAFVSIILPIVIYLFVSALYDKKRKYATRRPSRIKYAVEAVMLLLMISIVMLISCQFRFGLLVVGSDSMTGEINRGDAIIYDSDEAIGAEVGEVIVFNKEGNRVIHRITKIERINGQNRYYTKGDANDDPDPGFITDSDIIGVTNIKLAYIGYPTLWIRELFAKLHEVS